MSGEENMHKAIYYGFTAVGIKTALIKRLIGCEKVRFAESDIARELLDVDNIDDV